MTKEERELRSRIRFYFDDKADKKLWNSLVTAMRKAIIDECAKMCDEQAEFYRHLRDKGEPEYSKSIDMDTLRVIAAENCAAAIRGKK